MQRLTGLTALALLALGACDEGAQTIGPRGGTVVSTDGRVVLDVMENALDQGVELTIDTVDDGCEGVIGDCYVASPHGTQLTIPAFVTVEYDPGELGDIEPEDLAVVVDKHGRWRTAADRILDPDDQTVSGTSAFLTTFAVAERDDD